MIGKPDRADLSLFLQIEQRLPIDVERRSVLCRPVHLVEIDPLDLEPAQRALEFAADARRRADLLRQRVAIRGVWNEPAFRKHVRTLGFRYRCEGSSDNLLGMPEAVNGGGVDPVDAAGHGATDRCNGGAVVLAAPAHRPVAANCPGAEAD